MQLDIHTLICMDVKDAAYRRQTLATCTHPLKRTRACIISFTFISYTAESSFAASSSCFPLRRYKYIRLQSIHTRAPVVFLQRVEFTVKGLGFRVWGLGFGVYRGFAVILFESPPIGAGLLHIYFACRSTRKSK